MSCSNRRMILSSRLKFEAVSVMLKIAIQPEHWWFILTVTADSEVINTQLLFAYRENQPESSNGPLSPTFERAVGERLTDRSASEDILMPCRTYHQCPARCSTAAIRHPQQCTNILRKSDSINWNNADPDWWERRRKVRDHFCLVAATPQNRIERHIMISYNRATCTEIAQQIYQRLVVGI